MIWQKEIELPEYKRGFHLVTALIMKHLSALPVHGILHIFVKHTSAAIIINENADSSVRTDFENIANHMIPENQAFYRHSMEGADDMPAHIKSSLYGQSITLPVTNRGLNLGTWQGIYFCEFRNHGGKRKIVLTVYGEG
jgi:secondary thiamine-phosphate synthase enzyme